MASLRITRGALLSCLLALAILQLASSATMIYVQENQVTSSSVSTNTISGIIGSKATISSQYTVSLWIKQSSLNSGTQYNYLSIFNPSTNANIVSIGGKVGTTGIFSVFSTGSSDGYWNFENLNIEQQILVNKWTFVAVAVDGTNSLAYGFRYRLDSGYAVVSVFNQASPVGSCYEIAPSTSISWLGAFGVSCECSQAYVRLIIGYAASSNDEMVSLALRDPQSFLYSFSFESDTRFNNNQTVNVKFYTNLTQGTLTAIKGTSQTDTLQDPELGDINILKCRPETTMSFTSPGQLPIGVVIMMDVYPYSSYSSIQMLFALRDSSSNNLFLKGLLDPTTNQISLQMKQSSSWATVLTTTATVTLDAWNRVIFEIIQAQPVSFGSGYFSARIWINSVATARTYFASFASATATIFTVTQGVTIDLCSTKVSGTTTQDSSQNGYYDLTNFIWFRGSEGLYSQNTDLTCSLNGFLAPNQATCFQCKPNYLFDGGKCVGQCPSNSLPSTTTNSCQRCIQGKYFTADGQCTSCSSDGLGIVGSQCITCDQSCRRCFGISSRDCAFCYEGSYYYGTNSSCIACNSEGLYISGHECKHCHPSCSTCSGPLSTDCLTCPPGYSLYSIYNRSCVEGDGQDTSPNVAGASSFGTSTLQLQSASTSILPILLGGASTTAVLLVGFVSDILIYRFINVPFSKPFKEFASTLYSNFIPNPYSGLQVEYNVSKSSIGKFKEFGMSSVMLGNSGNSLDREAYALAMIILSLVGMYSFKKYEKIASVFMKIKNMFMWNVFLTYYIGDFTELVLFSLIQLRENECNGIYPGFACIISVLILASYVILHSLFAYLLNRKPDVLDEMDVALQAEDTSPNIASPSRVQNSRLAKSIGSRLAKCVAPNPLKAVKKPLQSRWAPIPSSLSMIIADIKQNNYFNRNYLLILQGKNLLIVLILLFLQDYGTAQAAMYLVIEIIYEILILGIFRSFEQKVQLFLFGVNQSCKVIIGIIALYIGAASPIPDNTNNKLGLTIIGITLAAIVINGLVAIASLFTGVKASYKKFKKNRQKKTNSVQPLPKVEPETPRNAVCLEVQNALQKSSISLSVDGSVQFERDSKNSISVSLDASARDSALLPKKSRFAPREDFKEIDLSMNLDHSEAYLNIHTPKLPVDGLDSPQLRVSGLDSPQLSVSGLDSPQLPVNGLDSPELGLEWKRRRRTSKPPVQHTRTLFNLSKKPRSEQSPLVNELNSPIDLKQITPSVQNKISLDDDRGNKFTVEDFENPAPLHQARNGNMENGDRVQATRLRKKFTFTEVNETDEESPSYKDRRPTALKFTKRYVEEVKEDQ